MNPKVRAKMVPSLLKKWPLNICSVQIQQGFSDALPYYSATSWVSALSGPATGDFGPSEYKIFHGNNALWDVHNISLSLASLHLNVDCLIEYYFHGLDLICEYQVEIIVLCRCKLAYFQIFLSQEQCRITW